MGSADRKLKKLRERIASLGSAAVAYSGGTDSTLVAKVAHDTLGRRAIAFTIDTPMYPRSEMRGARSIAKQIGIEHIVIKFDPLEDVSFAGNPPDRCYTCKLEGYRRIKSLAKELRIAHILDGSNLDDLAEFRPGTKANEELGIRSPLAEAGIGKKEARKISRMFKLPTADKNSNPCLATRMPYGSVLTKKRLRMIEGAEEFLTQMGFDDVRVRVHGDMARVEVRGRQLPRLASRRTREAVVKKLKALGFSYVSLDLEGYRPGSMDEVLQR